MDILKEQPGKVFRHYLFASLGSAVIMTIYACIDTIAVGQAEGPNGSAAMAIMNPLFGLFIFMGLIFGIGGSVLMSAAKGKGDEQGKNEWFSASVRLMGITTVLVWVLTVIFHRPLIMLLGADAGMVSFVMRYAWWLIGGCPVVIFSIFLACFVRNDGNPELAMRAVLIGGGFNIFGDWFFVFALHMGITGAGLATIASNFIQCVILLTHFKSKKCTIRLVKTHGYGKRLKAITAIGFGAGLLDLANVVLFAVLNQQVMHYGGAAYLAILGVVGNVATLCQSIFGGVGQALQPIASTCYGAKDTKRTGIMLRYAMLTTIAMGVVFTLICVLFPRLIVRVFMDATPEVLEIAGTTVSVYALSFLFMGINVVATYYLQSIMRAKEGTLISILRGLVVSCGMILILPVFAGITGVFAAMPAAELVVCVLALILVRSSRTRA